MMRCLLSLTLLLLLLSVYTINAQCTLDPPGTCENPVGICDADLAGGLSIDMSVGAPDGTGQYTLCGAGTVQNVTFFAFTAGATEITFELNATNCSNPSGMGAGIQWGLAAAGSECANGSELECNSGANTGLITITYDQFVIGEDYVIYVDGFGGSVCDLLIEVTVGSIGLDVGMISEPDPEFDGFEFDPPLTGNELCLGGSIGFSVTAPAGSNADLQLTINPPTADYPTGIIDVPLGSFNTIIDFNTLGTFDICGFAFNCCDSSDVVCETFEIIPIPEDILDDEAVCQNDLDVGYLPDGWQGPAIFSPGDYSIDIESPNYSCDLIQSISIEAQPLQAPEFVDMLVCGAPTVIDICNVQVGQESEDFAQSITCPQADKNGCDSLINLRLDFVFLQAILFDPVCVDGMLEFQLGFGGNVNDFFKYEVNFTLLLDGDVVWTENGQDWNPQNDMIIVPIANGSYQVEITVERFGSECLFTSNLLNAQDGGLFPDDPELDTWVLNPCILDSVIYSLSANNDPNNTYNWDISPSGGLVINENNTEIGVNWEGATPGTTYTICVEADNGCGKSPPICEDVEVIAQPIASYSLPDSVCLNSDAVLVYDGTTLQNGNYTWNFDGGTIDLMDDNVPGPFNISYSTTGKKLVSVTVSQGACESEVFLDSIVVVDELPTPVISCESETDFIQFTWDDVADGYIVNVLSAPAGAIFDEQDGSFTVTGLSPNDMVEIELIAIDNGVCNNVITTEDCIAQNCPPVEISIDSIVPICLNVNAGIIDLTETITPFDNNSTIEWSGDGIVDNSQGLFDPAVANPGMHVIVLDYVTDCPYNESITIEVLEQPVSTFTVTDTICITETASVNYTGTLSTGTFSWEFDDGNASGNGSAPFDISWDTPGIKTMELTVDNNGCTSENVLVNVVVQDTLQPLVISCTPNTNDITFNWNDVANSSGYLVTINNVEIGVQTDNSYFVDGLEPGNIVDISVVALSTNRCANVSDFESCTALNCPPVIIDLTTDNTSICLDDSGNTIQINADIIGGQPEGELTWFGTTAIDQDGVFDPSISGTGPFEIILEYDYLGCQEFDTIDITVLPTPVAEFEANMNVCITDSLALTFTGSFEDQADFMWVNPNGIVVGSGSDYMTGFSNPGTYNIELTLDEAGCVSEPYELEVVVEEELVLPSPGFECEANTESIEFSWPSVECAASYIVFVDGIEITTITSTSYEVTDLNADELVEFEIIAVSECACGDVLFSTNCTTENCPVLDLNIMDTDEICLDENTGTIQLEYSINGSPDISNLMWQGIGLDQNGVFDPQVSGPGNHFISVSFSVGNCDYVDNSIVRINDSPSAEIIVNDPSCSDINNGSIEVNPSGGSGEYQIFINNQLLLGNIIDTLDGNSYTVTVVDDELCEYSETFVLSQPQQEEISISGNTTVISGDSNSYSINSNIPLDQINQVTWIDTETGTIICEGIDCLVFEFAPENDINICAIVDYGNGCFSQDCIDIRSEKIKRVYIPNTFTPNDDGVNDIWNIFPNDEVISMPLLQVYNRWGEKIFEEIDLALDGSAPSWGGQFKGRRLNPGVYVYALNVVYEDGTTEIIYGDITIVN